MNSINDKDIERLAQLAQINLDPKDIPLYLNSLSNILKLISEMDVIDIQAIAVQDTESHDFQRFRKDEVTEDNQRDYFQTLTSHTSAGFYQVPKVPQ